MAQDDDDLKRIFHLVSATKDHQNGAVSHNAEDGKNHSDVITSEEEMMKALQLAGRSPISSGEYWKEDAGQINFDTFTNAVRREMIDSSSELIELFRRLLSATKSSNSKNNDLSPNSADESDLYITRQALVDVLQGGVDPMRSDEIEAIVDDFRLSGVDHVNGDGDGFKCKAISDHVVQTMRETLDEVRQRVPLDNDNNSQLDEYSRGTMAQQQHYAPANGMATVDGRPVWLSNHKLQPDPPLAAHSGAPDAVSDNSEDDAVHEENHVDGHDTAANHHLPSPQLQHVALSLSSRGFFCYDFASLGATPTQDAVVKAQQSDEKAEMSIQHSANNNGSDHQHVQRENMPLMSNLFRMGIAQAGIFSISITALSLPYAKQRSTADATGGQMPAPDVALFLLHELDNGVKRVIGFTDKLIRSHDTSRRRSSSGSLGVAGGRRSSASLANNRPQFIDDEVTYSCTLELEPGTYILLPFISDCVFKPTIIDMNDVNVKNTDDTTHSLLYVREGREQIKLTPDYERAIHTMFDMIDLDSDTLISKDEFNLFALRTSGVEIREEEWKLALKAFATKNGHLTRVGFLQLHIAEAVDADDDNLEDLWVPLHQMGFDSRLFLANALPFRIDVQGERLTTTEIASNKNGAVANKKKFSLSRRESQQSNQSLAADEDELVRFLVALPHKSISTLMEKAASRLAVAEQSSDEDRPQSAGLAHRGRTETLAEGVTLKIYRDEHRGIWLVDNKRTEDIIVNASVEALDNCIASFSVASSGSVTLTHDGSVGAENDSAADKTSIVARRKRIFAGKCAIIVNVVGSVPSIPFSVGVNVRLESAR